eukprot:3667116-Prymnesium_polylepis.1
MRRCYSVTRTRSYGRGGARRGERACRVARGERRGGPLGRGGRAARGTHLVEHPLAAHVEELPQGGAPAAQQAAAGPLDKGTRRAWA